MIPRVSFRTEGRTCVRIAEANGTYLLEPMRFLFPFEAKLEAKVHQGQIARCRHNWMEARG